MIEDKEAMVNIYEFLFVPGAVEVTPGTTITWINHDIAPHTVTSGITGDDNVGETFDSPELQPGQDFNYTFNEPGIYPYFCRFHPNMTGRVIVSE
jgi:plastocyanin